MIDIIFSCGYMSQKITCGLWSQDILIWPKRTVSLISGSKISKTLKSSKVVQRERVKKVLGLSDF